MWGLGYIWSKYTCEYKHEEGHHEVDVEVLIGGGDGGGDSGIVAEKDAVDDDGGNLPQDGEDDEEEMVFGDFFLWGVFGLGVNLGGGWHAWFEN